MNTPETDAAERMAFSQEYMVPTELARKLERERDEWKNKFQIAVDKAAKAENELFAVKAELDRIKK